MAYQVDWESRVIAIPKEDMSLLQSTPSEVRQLDALDFWLKCRDLEDSAVGMLYPPIVSYNEATVVAGTQLSAVVRVINDYKVVFEDGLYNVNLTGANNNLSDRSIKNLVGLNSNNSSGLVTVEIENKLTKEELEAMRQAVASAMPDGKIEGKVTLKRRSSYSVKRIGVRPKYPTQPVTPHYKVMLAKTKKVSMKCTT